MSVFKIINFILYILLIIGIIILAIIGIDYYNYNNGIDIGYNDYMNGFEYNKNIIDDRIFIAGSLEGYSAGWDKGYYEDLRNQRNEYIRKPRIVGDI